MLVRSVVQTVHCEQSAVMCWLLYQAVPCGLPRGGWSPTGVSTLIAEGAIISTVGMKLRSGFLDCDVSSLL